MDVDKEEMDVDGQSVPDEKFLGVVQESMCTSQRRDEIAAAMWEGYSMFNDRRIETQRELHAEALGRLARLGLIL